MADVATYTIRLKFVASMDTAGLRAADTVVNKLTRDLENLNAALRKINQSPDPGGFKGMGHNVSAASDKVRALRRELSLIRSREFQINPVHGPLQPSGPVGLNTGSSLLNMLGRTAMQSAQHMVISNAMNATTEAARFMFNANVEMDEAIGNLAATAFISGETSLSESRAFGKKRAQELARMAAEGTGDLGDYLEANQLLGLAARTAGADDAQLNKVLRGAVVMGNVIGGVGGARVAARDVQQALTSGIGSARTPMLNLALRGAGLPAEAEEFNKLSMEERLELILQALERFNESEVLAKQKFTTQVDILRENLAEMARALTGDMFEDVADGLRMLNEVLDVMRPVLLPFLQLSGRMVQGAGSGLVTGTLAPGSAGSANLLRMLIGMAAEEYGAMPEVAAPGAGGASGAMGGAIPAGTTFAAVSATSMLLPLLREWFLDNPPPPVTPYGPQLPELPYDMQAGGIGRYDWTNPFPMTQLFFPERLTEEGPERESFFAPWDNEHFGRGSGRGRGRGRKVTINVNWGDRSLATTLTTMLADAGNRQADASLATRDSGEVW